MKRFLTAIAISIFVAADAPACMPERPTHNAYMFSVFRREAMSPPFREAMNSWWKRYGGEPQSDDANYYENNADRLRKAAERRGDRQMLDYMRWLDAYLDVCRGIGMDKWDYPTKQELASRDSTLRLMLDAAQAYRGGVMREQYALLAMRANMLLGRDKANMLYWTATASKLPEGVWRDMCRNIYARALLGSGLARQACDIYAGQGDMQSIKWCMRNYRNLAGIMKVYADSPDSPTLLFLVQDFVNNVQETIDSSADGRADTEWIKMVGANPVMAADAKAFVKFADGVLGDRKTSSPCLWQSAAAMVCYLLGDSAEARSRAAEAVEMGGSARMRDNARCIRLLVEASCMTLGGDGSAWLADEMRWLDSKITEERGASADYFNHYTDVKERVAYRVLAPRYAAAGRTDVTLAVYGMMEENHLDFHTGGKHADAAFTWQGDWAWNRDYSSDNEYFEQLSNAPADTLARYYAYLTSAKTDVFEHYVATQVYQDKNYYNDLIGTRYLAEGRFAEAKPYLEKVDLAYLGRQNISWYMAGRDYTVERWFRRQLPNVPETDGPNRAEPGRNLKLDFVNDMTQLAGEYSLAPAGSHKDELAYALAVRYYQASCYGDCWFLAHYAHSVNDSARVGELDFAAKAAEYLAECSRSADLNMQYKALYALAFADTDPWYTATFDRDYNMVIVPRPASSQYRALAALSLFAKEHPEAVDDYVTRCDVLKEFEKAR